MDCLWKGFVVVSRLEPHHPALVAVNNGRTLAETDYCCGILVQR